MDGSIELSTNERKMLLQAYRSGTDSRVARRAHIVLLRADGLTWEHIRRVLYCSNDLIADTLHAWASGGVAAVLEPASAATRVPAWLLKVLRWVSQHTPQDFGFFRSRWSCDCLSALLGERGWRVSGESVRRGLHRLGYVWRRPRPIVGPTDPEFADKLQGIQDLLAALPGDEVAVFQDEVDIHLNPKIGAMWMRRGEQAVVPTPGNNRKCHLAGSLVWGTGTLLVSQPEARRNTELFLAHLDDLRRRLRSWKRIHVICDNAPFHKSRAVREYLARWGHRVELHYLPKYAPETNPIERVWWHLHETITRNHCCETLEDLVRQAYAWFRTKTTYFTEMRRTFAKAAA